MKKDLYTVADDFWTFIINPNSEMPENDITGKYLFFSESLIDLIVLAKHLMVTYGLPVSKVPLAEKKIGSDFVLCVYDKDAELKGKMAIAVRGMKHIYFRGWKSDEQTLNGEYSKQFISNLSENGQE